MADRENILVTGGGSGIGRAVAIRMGKQMTVIVADLNEDGANETVAEIEKAGGAAYAIKTDVSDSASVRDMKDFIAKDILYSRTSTEPLSFVINQPIWAVQWHALKLAGGTCVEMAWKGMKRKVSITYS